MHTFVSFKKGLLFRYQRKYRESFNCFYFACRDMEWREQSLINMIEIYLNLDDVGFWTKPHQSVIGLANINAIENLIDKLRVISKDTTRVGLFQAYCELLKADDTKRSYQNFLHILERKKVRRMPSSFVFH